MKIVRILTGIAGAACLGMMVHAAADSDDVLAEKLAHIRNLAKAFYENPNTKKEAAAEFKKAFDLRPDSVRERLNYGLALLRAGETDAALKQIEAAQKQDPAIPHTWFNLGIEYKKLGDFDAAIEQFEQMEKLVPDEAVTQYNLGVLYKRAGRMDEAIAKFNAAARIDSSLAAPHFQLFNTYRTTKQREKAQQALEIFKLAKEAQSTAVVGEDMNWSFYSEVYDVVEPRQFEAAELGPLQFETTKLSGSLDGKTAGLLALDANGNGQPDLLAWSARGMLLYMDARTPSEDSGLDGLAGVTSAAAGDFDNDGLADLAVTTDNGAELYKNTGGKFTRQDVTLPARRFEKTLWLDFDHDNDLDLFLIGSQPALMRNQGEAGFADRTTDFPFAKGNAVDAVAIRVMPDTKMTDLVVSNADGAGIRYRDRLSAQYEVMPLPLLPAGSLDLTVSDVNNDSFLDLAYRAGDVIGLLVNRDGVFEPDRTTAQGAPVFADLGNRGIEDLIAGGRIHRNLGQARFVPGADADQPISVTAAVAADFSNDGKTDLVLAAADGSIHLMRNMSETNNRWLEVTLNGKKAPKLAPGSEVEVKVGRHYQKKLYCGFPVLFGVGQAPRADTVRITWSNGLIQNQMSQATNESATYVEEERLSGSCPMIWTWDGRKFRFITDVLGVGPLGVRIGPNEFFPADHDEYILLPEGALAAKDGAYEIRLTQELAEVVYMDEVKLIAVDHPANMEIFTNEKATVPFPEFKLYGVRERAYPIAAVDHQSRDVLAQVLRSDKRYVDRFERLDRRGVAEMHSLELDFGKNAAPDNDAVLVLDGWVDWAEGGNYVGFAQENEGGLVSPYLQVRNQRGEWETVIENMGVPAGLPKTIVVDLAGKFLSDSREVRIVTNMCLYWDEVFLATDAHSPEVKLTQLRSNDAEVRFRGFARIKVDPAGRKPQAFFYDRPEMTAMWNQTPGLYTRYGDVTELVAAVDDRFVIYGAGDEVRLQFDARRLPALAPGWKRTFVLGVDGWEKDQDANTMTSHSVEPLPFHGMSTYPYPEGEQYPDSETHRMYLEKYNIRPGLRLMRPLTSLAPMKMSEYSGE